MALDCDAAAASEAIYPVEFLNSKNTKIPMGQQASGVCYSEQTVVTGHVDETRRVLVFGEYNTICPPHGDVKVPVYTNVHYNYDKTEVQQIPHAWRLSGFNIEARGKMRVWWRDDGHLMVTITDLYSTLTGSDGDTGRAFWAPLYSGNIGWALNAVASVGVPGGVPGDGDGNWKFCLGGWWSAGMLQCGTQCPDANGNPGGGTPYMWNNWSGTDAKFVQNGRTPGRMDGPIEWDLGEIEPSENLGVFLYARGVRGACGSQRFDPNMGARQAIAFAVPLPALCPPEITGVEMQRDICEEKVWADVKLDIPALGGNANATLYIEYAPNDTFYGSTTVAKTVNASSSVTIEVGPLIPNIRYCFRAKLSNGKVESEWSSTICETALFMPRADWVVPLLTLEECEAMTEGDCIPEFTEDTPGLEECKGEA